jgi:ribA/ribD-fused uncharacterized protein
MKIAYFREDYFFLSNFAYTEFTYAGHVYPTAEHAFQSVKATTKKERAEIAAASSPGAAKGMGHRIRLRPDWDEVRIPIMQEVLAAKFSVDPYRMKLYDTGDAYLEEGNNWHDAYWGVCNGHCRRGPHEPYGENILGRLLMERRRHLTLRVMVTGSREWEDEAAIRRRLARLPKHTTIIHGAAKGADMMADRAARDLGFKVDDYPADWKAGLHAGFERNKMMIDLQPDVVLAFHKGDSSGTAHAITLARMKEIRLEVQRA